MNRKLIIILTLLLLVLLLAGCSSSTTTNNYTNDGSEAQQDQEKQNQDSNDQDSSKIVEPDEDSSYEEEDLYTYKLDTEYSIDLNNDGEDEKIVYSNKEDVISMTINGNTFEITDRDSYMTYYRFRTVDIDTNDNYVEIILREAYPPMDDCLAFYRYDGKDLYSIGSIIVGCLIDEHEEIRLDGSGMVTIAVGSNIMQDGIYNRKYIINESESLEKIPLEDITTYISPITSKVNKEIRGYEGKSIDQSYETIPVGDEIVIYGEIDNWLKIKWNDKELWVNNDELTHFDPNWPDVKFEFDGIQFWS